MKSLTRILAATDLSAPARHAVDRGFRLAAEHLADYTVMHALELDTVDVLREWLGEDSGGLKQRLETQARDTLAHLLADPARNHGVAAMAVIAAGPPLLTILAQAEAIDAGLIVVGARGSDFLRHMLLGSTASRLLRKAAGRPVLVVKQPPHETYRRLLVPIDFSPFSTHAVGFARQLAPRAELVLMHGFDVPFEGKLALAGVDEDVIRHYRIAAREEALRRLRQVADEAGVAIGEYTPMVMNGDPSQQIVAQEQELDCDLIVMGKHGVGFTEELLLGSVTKHVLAESQCDVLVIGERKPA